MGIASACWGSRVLACLSGQVHLVLAMTTGKAVEVGNYVVCHILA